MSITTYAELQTAMANWLKRDDLTARIPEFISLAEASFRRKLRNHWRAEVVATLNTTSAVDTLALPAGFLEMRSLHLNTNPKQQLEYMTPQQVRTLWLGSVNRRPEVFSLVAGNILFGPTPDSVYEVELDYFAFEVLSDSNTTNWLLTYAEDIYLYGSLVQAEPYLGADERIMTWAGLTTNGMNELLSENRRAKRSGPMTMTSDVRGV